MKYCQIHITYVRSGRHMEMIEIIERLLVSNLQGIIVPDGV